MMGSNSNVSIPRLSSPAAVDVIAGRIAVKNSRGLGITAAQDWCAEQVHSPALG